jgi:putative ABC transport system substrate-binding protein
MVWPLSVVFVAASLLAWPVPLSAQQAPMPVIGVLSSASAALLAGEQFQAFDAGLKEGGYANGQNLKVEYRWANDDYTRLPALAAELVRLRVAVIVAAGGQVSALAAHRATKEIPVVFTTVADPVKSGLVASLNRPGGNVTGTAGLTSELDPKRLEFLQQLVPEATLIGVLVNPKRPGVERQTQELRTAANQLKLKLEVQEAATASDIDVAFESFAKLGVGALLVTADPFFNSRRTQLIALTAKTKLPAIYQWLEFVAAGGLISYGPRITEAYQIAGRNAGRILNGTKPADIPVVQPSKFELVINLKAAGALGLKIPRLLLSRADSVIE